jgi:hypothetical protein
MQSLPALRILVAGVLSVFVALFADRIYWVCYSTLIIAFPRYLRDPFVAVYSSPKVANYSCPSTYDNIQIVDGIDTFDELYERVNTQGLLTQEPLLFKRFLSEPEDVNKQIKHLHRSDKILFTNVSLESFGNTWMNGIRPFGSVEMTVEDAFGMVNEESSNSVFASFVPFLEKESINIALKNPSMEVHGDSNFISNFKEEVLSTRFHSAIPIDSYSLQLQGRKLWIFMDPKMSQRYSPLGYAPNFFTTGNEEMFFRDLHNHGANFKLALAEEGDLLYFPPQWPHAVITSKGPNFMLNMRVAVPLKSLFVNPFRFVEWALGTAIVKATGQKPRKIFSYAQMRGFNKRMNEFFQSMYGLDVLGEEIDKVVQTNGYVPTESPCKESWVNLLRHGNEGVAVP